MNLQENIRRILREEMELNPTKRVYDYDPVRDTVPERLPFDIDKLVDSGVVFVTPAIDGDPKSETYKEWTEEPHTHLISLYNVEHSSEDGWIKKAITKGASTEQYKNFVNKIYDGKYNQILWSLEKLGINPMDMLIDMNIQENIRRILMEDYSPAGKEIIPNSIVVHKSNPIFRDNIMSEGLKVKDGECYKIYVGYGTKCKPAIFATNSTNKRAWFDSTYDDDIWEINTEMIPDVKWYKDRHFESSKKHIVTFENIPADAITLKHEGTGKDWGLMESVDKSEDKKLKFVTKIIHEFFDEVSFIEIKKYQNKPLIRVYFDNDGDASNEESYFAEQIQDKIYQYTGIKLLPYWQLEQYSTDSDFRLDAIKLKYDDEGNVINESEENKKEKNSNYLEMIRELIEPFKKEDCVCNIKVSFDDDMYDIYLEFGTEELNDKFYSVVGKNHYVKNLKNNVKNTIKNYLSIDNLYVGSYGTPRCGWTKN